MFEVSEYSAGIPPNDNGLTRMHCIEISINVSSMASLSKGMRATLNERVHDG